MNRDELIRAALKLLAQPIRAPGFAIDFGEYYYVRTASGCRMFLGMN